MKLLEGIKSVFPFRNKPHLDVVFLHIHKTGGKSVSKVLKEVYGGQYARVNRAHLIRNEMALLRPGVLDFSNSTKVLAGHLRYNEVTHLIHANTKIITWLRHPVERVVSNFYWDQKRFDEGLSGEVPAANLEEYALRPSNQNRISFFLNGLELKRLFFIGFIDTFDEDLKKLSDLLGWRGVKYYHINKNTTKPKGRPVLSIEQKELIIRLNASDMQLYNEALSMKANGQS